MNSIDENKQDKIANVPEKKPNEVGGFFFSSFLKISDPNTKEILIQTRGDN